MGPAVGVRTVRGAVPRLRRPLLRRAPRDLRRPGGHARLPVPHRRPLVDDPLVRRADRQSALVDRPDLRDPHDRHGVLDRRAVLHRAGVCPARVRRRLGAHAGHHGHRPRVHGPPPARDPGRGPGPVRDPLRPGTGGSAGGATGRPPARAGAGANAPGGGLRSWLEDAYRLDLAVYAAVAATPTPTMDEGLRRLSGAADHSKLWVGCSALLAAIGGPRGRRAAENGLASIALTSAVVNLGLKPLGNRRRPDRVTAEVPLMRQVTMPRSTSWPSGHSASAFAFATGAGAAWPAAGIPLSALASFVAYSRVHTGVHYPSDTIAGTVAGVALAPVAVAAVARRRRPSSRSTVLRQAY